jgi:hypothetical protein
MTGWPCAKEKTAAIDILQMQFVFCSQAAARIQRPIGLPNRKKVLGFVVASNLF